MSIRIKYYLSRLARSTRPNQVIYQRNCKGRLPIRVELEALTEEQLYKILTEPKHNLIAQQRALLATENVMLEFTEEAIREIARVAALANRTIENIGARRLHTCIERIIDEISFDACDYPPGDLVTPPLTMLVSVQALHPRIPPLPKKCVYLLLKKFSWPATWPPPYAAHGRRRRRRGGAGRIPLATVAVSS